MREIQILDGGGTALELAGTVEAYTEFGAGGRKEHIRQLESIAAAS